MPKSTARKAPARRAPRKTAAAAAAPAPRASWPSALAKAQQESANLLDSIRKQGQRFEQRTKQAAADTAAAAVAARGAATAKAKEMQQIAGGTWDKLEQVFEDRVARALSKLGIYTQSDIQRLSDRVDALSAAVDELRKAQGAPAKRPAKRATKS